jgi:hypothetical protein
MSEYLQFGQHPDADQIGAFVEHSLPAHEREKILGHLSVCSECRAVVALSLPVLEEPAKASAMPVRKPWFSGWKLAWPAAAFALLAIFIFYLHRADLAPNASAPNQMASVYPPTPIASQAESTTASAKPTLHGSPSIENNRVVATDNASQQKSDIADSKRSIAEMQMETRNVGSLNELTQSPPVTLAGKHKNAASDAGMSGGIGAGTGYGDRANLGANVSASESNQLKAAAPAQATRMGNFSALPATGATAMEPSIRNRETITVQAAPGIETESSSVAAKLDDVQISQFQIAQFKHRLPSRLPVLSMATQGRLIVAIDTHNAVFLSADAGKHWKAVYAQWPGRAVKADLVVFPTKNRTGYSQDKLAKPEIANSAIAAKNPSTANVTGSSMIGTVTDPTGAVIPEASVVVIDHATHVTHSVRTDSAGRFMIDALAPGSYRVEAQAKGFQKQVLADVAVTAERPAVVNISLNIGAVSETVTVATENQIIPALKKTKEKPVAASETPVLFEIVTENGKRWTSVDGATWTPMESHPPK